MSFRVRKLNEEKPRRSLDWKKYALIGVAIVRPVMRYIPGWRKRNEEVMKQAKRVAFLKRILLILVAVLCAVLLFAGVVKALIAVRVVNVQTIVSITGTPMPTDENGFTNFLLLGQGDTSGQNLTDTIIIASVDPTETKSVVMLSIPRDTYLLQSHTEKMGAGKINAMYRDYRSYLIYQQGLEPEKASMEAIQELANEVGRLLGIEIHHVAKVDFEGFVKAVDAVGGVDIDVPYDIVDTTYPTENYGYQTFEIRAGPQHLDGETALKYVRSRHTTSDFGRSARQQQLLGALGEKVKNEGLHKDTAFISNMWGILQEDVETTMNLREMIGAAGLGEAIDRSRIVTMQLNDRNALYDGFIEPGGMMYTPPRDQFGGAAVLLPVSIPPFPVTWKQPAALSTLLFHMRGIYLADPPIAILNGGARSGLARKLGTELIRYGFDVPVIENASLDEQPTSFISARTPEDETLALFFAELLGLELRPLPEELPDGETEQITIILGEDYSYTPIQNLLEQ